MCIRWRIEVHYNLLKLAKDDLAETIVPLIIVPLLYFEHSHTVYFYSSLFSLKIGLNHAPVEYPRCRF